MKYQPNWCGAGDYIPPKLGDPCQKCRERPSTTQWVGNGGWMAVSHGLYRLWCDVCVLTEQLKYARIQAKRIPEIERRLRNAKRRKPGSPERVA